MSTRSVSPRESPVRLVNIQLLRGVAAGLVVVAHSVDASQMVAGHWGIESAGFLENFGAFGVDLFFVISGFVMALSIAPRSGARAAGDFVARRWIRIAPPYLIASAIGVVVLASTYRLVPTAGSWVNTLLFVPVIDEGAFSTPLLPVGWTLSFEFTFYVLVAALVCFRLARRPEILAVAIGLLVAVGHVVPDKTFLAGWITNPMLLEFAAGIAIYVIWRDGWVVRLRPVAIAVGGISIAALGYQVLAGYGAVSEQQFITNGALSMHRAVLWGIPASGIFLAAIALPSPRRGRISTAFERLGERSYSIYLIHLPLVALLATSTTVLWPGAPGWLVLVLAVGVGIGGGVVFFGAVERPSVRVVGMAYDSARGRYEARFRRRVPEVIPA